MRRFFLVATCTVVLAPSPGAAQEEEHPASLTDTIPESVFADMVDRGSRLFNGGFCIFCHAVGGRGDGRRGPDLTDVEWLHSGGDFEGVAKTIQWGVRKEDIKAVTPRPFAMNPSGGMPLTFEERQAVAAYVWSLGHGRQTPKVVAQNQFLRLLERGQVTEAMQLFDGTRRADPDSLMFDERAINLLGYEFLRGRSQPEVAIRIFLLNTELHPDSWNVWDSLAEGYMVAGDRNRAIEFYEKAIDMNPNNEKGKETLAKLRGGG